MKNYTLTKEQTSIIADIISRGNRAELIPVKDGVRIFEIRRSEVKQNKDTSR